MDAKTKEELRDFIAEYIDPRIEAHERYVLSDHIDADVRALHLGYCEALRCTRAHILCQIEEE